MKDFIEWLPEKTGRAFLIQLNKYFELKYPNASEEVVKIITTDALEYINHNFDIEKIEQSIEERNKIYEKK